MDKSFVLPSDALLLVVHPSRKFDVSASCGDPQGQHVPIDAMVSSWDPSRVVIIHDPADDHRRWYVPQVDLAADGSGEEGPGPIGPGYEHRVYDEGSLYNIPSDMPEALIGRIEAASPYPLVWSRDGFFDPADVPLLSSARDVVLIGGCWSMCLGKGASISVFNQRNIDRVFFPFDAMYDSMLVDKDGTLGYYGLEFKGERIDEWMERRSLVSSSSKKTYPTFRVREILDDLRIPDQAQRAFLEGPLDFFQGSAVVDYFGLDGLVLRLRARR